MKHVGEDFYFKRETLFLIISTLLRNNKYWFLMFFCLKIKVVLMTIKVVLTTFDKNSDYYNNWGGLKPNIFQR